MNIDQKTQEKINLIHVYEQNLQSLSSQKQNFQAQALELESSIAELKNTKKAYKIIGNIMVSTDISALKKDVASKKEMLDIRIKSIEKQEEKIRERISDAQKGVMSAMKGK